MDDQFFDKYHELFLSIGFMIQWIQWIPPFLRQVVEDDRGHRSSADPRWLCGSLFRQLGGAQGEQIGGQRVALECWLTMVNVGL
jgi:hypothetical protein